ncbi:MAG: hypothetical protein ACKO2Z_35030, partial [Sphaerospermopsis kisseleviana]
MPSIIELINNQPGVVQRAIDLQLATVSSTGEVYRDGYPDPALNRFFPFVNYSDPVLALLKMRSYTPTVGYVVATDGSVPQDSERLTVTQETFGNFKLAKSRVITEEDFIVARQAEQLALSGNGQAAEAIRNMFLAVPAMLTQSLINLHTVMTLQVACTGICNYVDPTSGVTANLSYASQVPSGNLATALTSTAVWSNWANANGINDIVSHMNDYYNNLKKFPPFIVMSRKTANDLRNQNSTKVIVARNSGVIMEVGTPDAAAIGQLPPPSLEAVSDAINKRLLAGGGQNGTVQIIVSDGFYYQRGANTSGTLTLPYIPANYYFFATDNYIERAIVPTASNNFAGGLVTTTEIISKEPPQEKITVAGRGFPLVPDPRFIGA